MDKRKLFHYFLLLAALSVIGGAFYCIYLNPKNLISACLIIVACALVAFAQNQIIKRKN